MLQDLKTVWEIIQQIPSQVLFFCIFVILYFQSRSMLKMKKLLLSVKSNYDAHIIQSTESNRENLRSNLRKLHSDMFCTIMAGKEIPEVLIEEYYEAFELYKKLGGNGYIKHQAAEVDEWVEEQSTKKIGGAK